MGKLIRIRIKSLKKFEDAFIETKFDGMTLEGVLEAYFGVP